MDFTIKNKITILIAKRCSGKSILLKKLVNDVKNDFDKIFVICPTENVNNFYKKSGIVEQNYIFDNYSEKFGEALIKKMTEVNKDKNSNELKHVLLILDDCIADVNLRTSPSLKKLFVRGRHIAVSIICTSQNLTSLSPLERNNSDFILTGQLNASSLDCLIEDFLPSCISKKDFINYYSKAVLNYGFLILNNNSTKTDNIDEIIGVLRVNPDEI
jgi:hypothetical protein